VNTWKKHPVLIKIGSVLYVSVVFTWQIAEAGEMVAKKKHSGKVIAGGPAIALMGKPTWADEVCSTCPFDILAAHNPCATFTTRGCPNKCKFCAVPKIEGDFVELRTWRPGPIICDNNLLACSKAHFERVVQSLRPFPSCDFNQGLEAKLFTIEHARLLAKLKNPIIRFAFDTLKSELHLGKAIRIALAAKLSPIRVYVLLGFNDTQEDGLYRLDLIHRFRFEAGKGHLRNIVAIPMRYQPLNSVVRNSYVPPNWDVDVLKDACKYYPPGNFQAWTIPFQEWREKFGTLRVKADEAS